MLHCNTMTPLNPIRRTNMITTPDNLVSANKAAVETFLTLANTAFASTERLAALNLSAARSFLEDSIASTKALMGAKDMQQLIALQTTLAQPLGEKLAAYSRNAYEIASQTQEEVSKVVEAQFADVQENVTTALNKASRNAPAGSDVAFNAVKSAFAAANSAYENIGKATKQVVEIAEANMAAATSATMKAAGAATKAKKAA